MFEGFYAIYVKDVGLVERFEDCDSNEDLVDCYTAHRGIDAHGLESVSVSYKLHDVNRGNPLSRKDWRLIYDWSVVPGWFDAVRAESACWFAVQRLMVRDKRDVLIGGRWMILPSARVLHIHGKLAYAVGANLRGVKARALNARRAALSRADLSESYLVSSDLLGAYAVGASFESANLNYANLRVSTMFGVDFRRASLAGADLRSMNVDDNTKWEGANLDGAVAPSSLLKMAREQGAVGVDTAVVYDLERQ